MNFCLNGFLVVLYDSEEDSAMVFVSNEVGEHSITTRDLSVNENTIIQFEVLGFVLPEMLYILSWTKRKISDNFMHYGFPFLYKDKIGFT